MITRQLAVAGEEVCVEAIVRKQRECLLLSNSIYKHFDLNSKLLFKFFPLSDAFRMSFGKESIL